MKVNVLKAWARSGMQLSIWLYVLIAALLAVIALLSLIPHELAQLYRPFLLIVFTVGYSYYRATGFHPIFRAGYRNWLRLTPWNWRKPLPLGPVHPVWEDAAILLLVTFLWRLFLPAAFIAIPVLIFTCIHIPAHIVAMILAGRARRAYAALFATGAIVYVAPTLNVYLIIGVALAVYLVTSWWMLDLLKDFTWQKKPDKLSGIPTGHYDILTGRSIPENKGIFLSVQCAAMTAWWVYLILRCIFHSEVHRPSVAPAALGYAFTAIVFVVFYSRVYSENLAGPISLFGRIFNGLWIIPGFDYVWWWLPGAALIVGGAIPFALYAAGVSLPVALAVSIAAEITILSLGPSPRKWHLTGAFKIELRKPEPTSTEPESRMRAETRPADSPFRQALLKYLPERMVTSAISNAPAHVRRVRQLYPTVWRVIPKNVFTITIVMVALIFGFAETCHETDNRNGILAFIPILLFGLAMNYGVYRVTNFHPAHHEWYRNWLKNTPWHPKKELPFGPVHLVWQDGVVILALAAMAWLCIVAHFWIQDHQFSPKILRLLQITAITALIVLGGYSLMSLVTLMQTGRTEFAAACLILLGAMSLNPTPVWCGALLVTIAMICSVGMRRSINDFPWTNSWKMLQCANPTRIKYGNTFLIDSVALSDKIGAMQNYLSPKMEIFMPRRRTRVLACIVLAWWTFVIVCLIEIYLIPRAHGIWMLVYFTPIVFEFFVRAIVYSIWSSSPISFWGRVFTLRWIMWRSDKPLLITLGILIVSIVMPFVFIKIGIPLPIAIGASAGIQLALFTMAGPSIRSWRLTGAHSSPRRRLFRLYASRSGA